MLSHGLVSPVEELQLEGARIRELRPHGVHQLRVGRDTGQLHQLRLAAERALRLGKSETHVSTSPTELTGKTVSSGPDRR